MRDLLVEYNNLSRADGSAIFADGNTVIQTAIFGPADIPFHKEIPDKATLEVIYKRSSFTKDSEFYAVYMCNLVFGTFMQCFNLLCCFLFRPA